MIQELVELVRKAHAAILDIYHSDFGVSFKADNSPVTEADLTCHAIINEGLAALDSTIPILSEEARLPPYHQRVKWRKYWIVDPIDGTREFTERVPEFTVNIALIEEGKPILGVVGVPVSGEIYTGNVNNRTAIKFTPQGSIAIEVRQLERNRLRIVQSRHYTSKINHKILTSLRNSGFEVSRQAVGSSLKMCLIADGTADLFVRFGPTNEWDTAAADAVLRAAGGSGIHLLDGKLLTYNTSESIINPSFFACAFQPDEWAKHIATALSLSNS